MHARARPNTGDWLKVRRELRTVAEVCQLAGITRHTLQSWRRRRDFPEPVLSFPGKGGALQLWSRTQVRAWLAEQGGAQWQLAHRLRRL